MSVVKHVAEAQMKATKRFGVEPQVLYLGTHTLAAVCTELNPKVDYTLQDGVTQVTIMGMRVRIVTDQHYVSVGYDL